MKTGIDIENISRMNEKLLEKIALPSEIEYVRSFKSQNEHIASLWCVKEAVVKLIGDKTISFLDIELTHEPSGRPKIVLHGKAKTKFDEFDETQIDVSISHTNEIAIAIVVAL